MVMAWSVRLVGENERNGRIKINVGGRGGYTQQG